MGDGEDTASLDRGRGFANFFDERGFWLTSPHWTCLLKLLFFEEN